MSVRLPLIFKHEDMTAFSALSGDANPLHMDETYARQMGFDGAVVFGALIVAKVSCLLGMHLPGTGGLWTGLKINFRNPLYVDEQAELIGEITHLSEATKMLSLKLRVQVGDRVVATATVESVFKTND